MDTTTAEHALERVYEDAHLLVVNKPSGMPVHRGWAPGHDTAIKAARELCGRFVHNVHRLDRATSGLLLMCFEPEVARQLQVQWPKVDKRYLALSRGRWPETQPGASRVQVIDYPIPNKEKGPRVPALSSLRCVANAVDERCALTEVRPHTGRLHQVRRHLKHLQHPIVGDVRHGDGRVNRHFREAYGLHRLALHAWSLRLAHPVSGQPLRVDLPPTHSFAASLAELGLPLRPANEAADMQPARAGVVANPSD